MLVIVSLPGFPKESFPFPQPIKKRKVFMGNRERNNIMKEISFQLEERNPQQVKEIILGLRHFHLLRDLLLHVGGKISYLSITAAGALPRRNVQRPQR